MFVSFHFSLCIFCFVLVLTSMHHESLVEVKKKKKGFVYCNSCLGKKGVAQSENRRCPLEWSRPGDPLSPERKIRVLSGPVSLGR